MIDIPSFDSLAHAAASAPEGYALYDKKQAREYIRARNEFIAFVSETVARSDLPDGFKLALIAKHPGRYLR